jgi:hypothetical protein
MNLRIHTTSDDPRQSTHLSTNKTASKHIGADPTLEDMALGR